MISPGCLTTEISADRFFGPHNIHARLYEGKDDDLIEWLETLPEGDRSRAIRQALRVGIGLIEPTQPELDAIAAIVRQAVSEGLAGAAIRGEPPQSDASVTELEGQYGDRLDDLLAGL